MEGLISGLTTTFGFSEEDAKFLDKFCTMAYEGKFDTDVKTGGKKFQFGFAELSMLVLSAEELDKQTDMVGDNVSERIQNGSLSNLRNVGYMEYRNRNLIEEDKKLFETLTSPKKDDNVIDKIKQFVSDNYTQLISGFESDVRNVYTCAYQDTFGLKPYIGVAPLTGNNYLIVDRDTSSIKSKADNILLMKKINQVLSQRCGVEVDKESRQIDIRKVISSDKPIYYPRKMLELQRCKVTFKSDNETYTSYAVSQAKDWGSYYSKDVKPWVEASASEALYWALYSINTDKYEDDEDAWSSDEAQTKMITALDRLKKSMCFSAIITQCVKLDKEVSLIKVRVVDVNSSLSANLTSTLLSGLSTNSNTEYEPGLNISAESGRNDLTYNIWEFSHDYDPDVTSAEPNFGYKAVDLLTRAGDSLDWNRILIGEDLKGTSLFAGKNGSLQIQNSLVHYVMAGSRAGKGVMTMNILASAIASAKPIFYLDRKPDMAFTFANTSGGNMFIVNGADKSDLRADDKYFNEDGIMLSGWREAYNGVSPAVRSFLGEASYYDKFGDFVYYRAITLLFGILMARIESAACDYQALGGDKGLVIIMDEISNWQNAFENAYFSPRSQIALNKNYASDSYIKKVKDTRANMKIANISLQNATKEEQAVKFQAKLEMLQDSLNNMDLEQHAYATTLLQAYIDTASRWAEGAKAGFANVEGALNDVFIIGQDVVTTPSVSIPNRSMPFTKTAGQSSCDENSGSILWGMTEQVSHDWFMGADINVGHRHMGANNDNTKSHKYLWAKDKDSMKGYWCYVAGASLTTINHQEVSGARYFKPYLVLGNNDENDTYVKQCAARVGKYWDAVKRKNLAEPYKTQLSHGEITFDQAYNHLHEGIGFDGLVNMIASSSGATVNFADVLAQSASIANYAAGCLGYSSYKDYLFDMSAEGIFSVRDIESLLKANKGGSNPQALVENRKSRLTMYYTLGLYDDGSEEVEEDNPMLNADNDMWGTMEEPVQQSEPEVNTAQEVVSTNTAQSNTTVPDSRESFASQFAQMQQGDTNNEPVDNYDEYALDFDYFANFVYDMAGIDFGSKKPEAIAFIKAKLRERGYHDVRR